MKIRTRITILFTFLTATILLAFAFVIYYSAKESREREFYALLKKEAITKANLFFNAEVETQTLQNIYRSNREILNEVEVAIYDSSFNLLYHDAVDIDFVKETPRMINDIYQKGELEFYQEGWQVVGLKYFFQQKGYIITAAAYDQYGFNKLNSLLKNSILVFIGSIFFIYLFGRIFSKKAFGPVKEMSDKAKKISATNLDLRLNNSGNKDELSELANTFNEMLSRLENSFETQKHFVSNISHELRTPLAAIIAELELANNKVRSIEEYKTIIQNALNDSRKLVRLINSLLDLAKASYDPVEISYRMVRVDEVLLDARQNILQTNPNYKVSLNFESEFDDEQQLTIKGNEYLLKVAFANLIENGCKFSFDHSCSVDISVNSPANNLPANPSILIQFIDKGIGISQRDIELIFTPFYRGENSHFADGNGIGLSLTHKIILLHNGTITVSSTQREGTVFSIELPLEM